METGMIITNNPLVRDSVTDIDVVYMDKPLSDVLIAARDYVHKHHALLTHPLPGSIKPNESPYKSIIMSNKADALDLRSLRIIEGCIEACRSFPPRGHEIPAHILIQLQAIEYALMKEALSNHNHKSSEKEGRP